MESRQVRRQKERRANKPAPASIERTASRWKGRTKGTPYSRYKLSDFMALPNTWGFLEIFHPTKGKVKIVQANEFWLNLFFPNSPNTQRMLRGVQ